MTTSALPIQKIPTDLILKPIYTDIILYLLVHGYIM